MTKKRVGILTMYYTNISHGGLLQAYSLCKKIEDLGYEVEQIKYDYNERFREISFLNKIKKYIKSIPRKLMLWILKDHSYEMYYSYMDEIPHSKLYRSVDMDSLKDKYDIFVVGSDQVWNSLYCDDYFYFPGIRSKKISYAASVGRDNLKQAELNSIAKKIKDFSYISVREKSLRDKLSSVSDKQVDLVCDPVFLNTAEFWECHLVAPSFKEKYVLVYLLGDDKKEKQKIVELARKTGYKVVTVPNVNLHAKFFDLKASDIVKWNIGPKEFLGLIKNAELVLTDSFHCVAFSIIFKKLFYCFDRGGNEKKMNSRLTSILNILKIEDRFIDLTSLSKIDIVSIDYTSVEKKLENYRKESELWLKKALEID